MFKKIKEKINNDEYVILFKKIWANKRYRSLLILFLYFIFFGIIIGTARSNYKNAENYIEEDKQDDVTVVEKMSSWNNFNDDYNYKVFVNDKEEISVSIKDGVNSLVFEDKSYIIINNNLYLNQNDDLKKINKIEGLEISIPITKLNVKDIMNYLYDLEFDSYKENIISYYVSSSYFKEDETDNILVEVIGDSKLEELIINYPDEKIMLKLDD